MNLKSRYKLSYLLDKEAKNLTLDVELKQIDKPPTPYQNIWEGHAMLNGKPYEDSDLSHCVDAKSAAMRIGHKLRNEIKAKARANHMTFRIKNEDLK
jgi:hypothetical protein